ncbi:DUF4179 domain-containing protein [Sporosarcina sp. Marseille-Q4943]|uniref:DUF4179 domain-containing protein n=1 Tax=Sporosarcina sp. Marseille-Q4943 TaxID=2942204 RepID=UPI00208DCE7B|nr:DUF4179 domain-containing protein [Sporosarcina sp. Marseille-Q4943]
MYENEEEKLLEMKDQLEKIHLPLDEADEAIRLGFDRAKREKVKTRKKLRRVWSLVAAALLFATFITSIRVSPAFANAVASIPGMEKFVDFVQFDKGLEAIFKNDYYQKVDAVQTKNGLTLTIDGVILDETGMNVYYTMKSTEAVNGLSIQSVDLKNEQDIPPSGMSYGGSSPFEKSREWASQIKYYFQEPTLFKDLSFTVEMDVLFQGETISFSLPFELKENVKQGKTIVLNQEVEIEGQKLTIREITIYPLRIAVKVAFDETNTKKILKFEDMRLEDEKGEVWGAIENGVVSSGDDTYFLQSNYFEEPKELYLRINKMQALDKNEATLVVDTDKGEILNGPKDDKLKIKESSRSGLHLIMPNAGDDPTHSYDIISTGKDANGKKINIPSTGMYMDEEGTRHWDMTFETSNYTNPLHLELAFYPNYITGNVKVELQQ